jgi:rhamnulokinase
LQYLPFNTVYQLAAEPWLTDADRLLLIPDLIGYWLTGAEVSERTNASTTGLLDALSGDWDKDLMDRLGYPSGLFPEVVDPGTPLGPLLPKVAERVGCSSLHLTAVGSHDTASAVVAVPMEHEDAAYISCGTWGLVGLELEHPVLTGASRAANFTNEGGVDGRVRFLTNVMGLWLLSETMRTWEREGKGEHLERLLIQASEVSRAPIFDVQDPRFLPPGDMPARICAWFEERGIAAPRDRPTMVRCIVESLAQAFADSIETAQHLSGRAVNVVHIVGGGALNDLLCQVTADRCGHLVLAGPVEATALGNVLVQGRAAGAVSGDLEELRRLVARTHDVRVFHPRGRLQR